jgi:hypothetical protein
MTFESELKEILIKLIGEYIGAKPSQLEFTNLDEEIKQITLLAKKTALKDKYKLADAAEMLWTVVANVSEGDWTKQNKEWQKAAARWRDNYFKVLVDTGLTPPREEKKISQAETKLKEGFK